MVAQDGELLGGDLELALAQPLGVVEANRGQHSDPRGDRVRRVEPPAQSGLDHRGIDPGCGESDKRRRRGELELGDRFAGLKAGVDRRRALRGALHGAGKGCLVDLLATDQHPFRPALGVRRDAGTGPHPVRFQQCRDHPRHRGLAVGADDVDRGEAVLGHAEYGVQLAHPL